MCLKSPNFLEHSEKSPPKKDSNAFSNWHLPSCIHCSNTSIHGKLICIALFHAKQLRFLYIKGTKENRGNHADNDAVSPSSSRQTPSVEVVISNWFKRP